MTFKTQWLAYSISGSIALASEVAWLIFGVLYEEGIFVFVTPILCFLAVVFLSLYLRKKPWAYRYSIHYAIGTGAIMAAFLGESTPYYGRYAVAMNIVEAGVLLSSAALLAVYFLPGIRAHFRAAANQQAATKRP